MFNLGLSEIILISVIALIFIGPKQLPEIARALGRALNELKKASEDLSSTIINPKNFINNQNEHTTHNEHKDTHEEIPSTTDSPHHAESYFTELSNEEVKFSEDKNEDLAKASQTEDNNMSKNKKADT